MGWSVGSATRRQQPSTGRRPQGPTTSIALAAAALTTALGMTTPSAEAQARNPYNRLYTLQTNCSVRGVEQRCEVEAFDGTGATVYRTTINGERTTIAWSMSPASGAPSCGATRAAPGWRSTS